MMMNYSVRVGQSEGNQTKSFCHILRLIIRPQIPFPMASHSNLWLEWQVTAVDCDTVSLEYLRQRGGGKLTLIQMDLEVWRCFFFKFLQVISRKDLDGNSGEFTMNSCDFPSV